MKLPELKDEHVKLILPSAGVLGLYLGGFLGAFLAARGEAGPTALLLAAAAAALAGGAAALLAAQIWLWPVGRFATIAGILKAWLLAAPLCWLVLRVVGERAALASSLQNALFWGAAFLSVLREERRR